MELPPSPAWRLSRMNLTPEQQRLLNVNPHHGTSRTWSYWYPVICKPELLPTRAQPYAQLIQQSAQKHGIDPSIMTGMLETESGWLPNVINGTRLSSAGARGIAQFMPATLLTIRC